ncbi:MAG: SOS response-associated peptidase [Gemmatimonadales bacterium]|nr:MAG: SOS response-associated peptidase [Gemmatimonadales bacterium]
MCGRFTLATPAAEWASLFDVEMLAVEPRFNIAPTNDIVVVRNAEQRPAPEAALLRWGLIPSWTDSPDEFPLLINARSETINSKPSFADAFRERRCLAVADGFYEWKAIDGLKRPFWIHRADGRPFGIAAIWDKWSSTKDERQLETCALVTTEASQDLADLHARMPVVLNREQFARWLDPHSRLDELAELMLPGHTGRFAVREVSQRVNSVRNDGEGCIAPAETQVKLFDTDRF